MKILAIFVTAFSLQAGADDPKLEEKMRELSQSNAWLRILHYKPKWISRKPRSLNDGKDFFFSPRGHEDPLLEMKATVEALKGSKLVGHLKQPVTCAFPHRFRFLEKHLGIRLPKPSCQKLDEFLNKFKAKSVSLIFSSATPNNPASMFGHTFLKINSGSPSELLDWGINFAAAVAEDENPFVFITFGVAGGYVGQYSMLPYFQKVNEYTNSESRDLWEYELEMSTEETRALLMHLWEMETNGYFAYYFFDENCSYQLLAAIEAVKPEWDLTDFPIYVIPGESVKKLTDQPGRIRRVRFRPSLQKQMLWAYNSLTPEEQNTFRKVSEKKDGVGDISSPKLLNALAVNYLYMRHRAGGRPPPEDLSYQAKLLARRSQFAPGDMVNIDEIPSETRPDWGHDSYRFGLWGGQVRRGDRAQGFMELSWKSAYHDLLNKDVGFSRLSHIDFPGIDLRYNFNDRALNIEKVTGIETTSIFPLSLVEKRLSWKFSGFSYSPKDFGCNYCHVLHADGGIGAALEVFHRDLVAFSMLLFQIEVGNSLGRGFRYGPGVYSGLIWAASENTKLMGALTPWWDVDQDQRDNKYFLMNLDASYALSRNWEMRFGFQKVFHDPGQQDDYEQLQIKFNKYFN